MVDFIVRAVDDSLKNDFGIAGGLADSGMTKFRGREMHKVQILDPAVGTGAFLARVAELVRDRVCKTMGEGAWKEYALDHLLPRLNGFEIMMSAYAMCHLKMALTLGDAASELSSLASRGDRSRRVNVFLTNALQMPEKDVGKITVIRWLWEEARAANRVKAETPVMVVLGNPPYNVSSQNPGAWIEGLMRDYKEGLKERNIAPLNDDYIKFIRCAEDYVGRNGRGVAAMITNNSFYDGLIHRRMRERLLESFDEIRILNLRGNANIGERAPDGGPDQNVFDIMQGVGVFIMTKTGEKKKNGRARVLYAECPRGPRKAKYEFLSRESVATVRWRKLSPSAPHFFFTPKIFAGKAGYDRGVPVPEFFAVQNSGVKSSCDNVSVHFDAESLRRVLDDFAALPAHELKARYPRQPETRSWTFQRAKEGLRDIPHHPARMCYRPFDIRHSVAAERAGGFIGRPRFDAMRQLLRGDNVALLTSRSFPANQHFTHAFVARDIVDGHAAGGQTYVFPLYADAEEVGNGSVRRANINPEIAGKFAQAAGMRYSEKKNGPGVVDPEALFDYIYAVLHRPSYRARFAEFLRIDFPKIPPARNESEFRRTATIGGKLRALHLLESPTLDDAPYLFSADGENLVDKVSFAPDDKSGDATGRVFINKKRHFANVPKVAWDFCIGGYYPAQKWLKDRRGRKLSLDDQTHYRRIIASLTQTAALTKTLDEG